MSETETVEAPQAPDPSDPNAAAANILAERAALERSYRERLEAQQQRLNTVVRERDNALQDRASLEFSTVSNALAAAERESTLIRTQIKAAVEAGDAEKVAELSVRAGEIGAELAQLRAGKQEMEAGRNKQLAPQTTAQNPADQVEAFLAKQDPRDAAWIRQQRDSSGNLKFFSDPAFQAHVSAAHHDAIKEGKPQWSPEYYAFIEERTGLRTKPEPVREPEGVRAPPAAPARPAASYSDNQRRGGDTGHVPKDVVNFCVHVLDFKHKKGEKAGQPDMAAIADYWRNSRSMAANREFKGDADPWAGAR